MRCEQCNIKLEIKKLDSTRNPNNGFMYWVNNDDFYKYKELVRHILADLELSKIDFDFDEALKRM